jgi:ribosome-binding protein aMBF1 (putative translation factor)
MLARADVGDRRRTPGICRRVTAAARSAADPNNSGSRAARLGPPHADAASPLRDRPTRERTGRSQEAIAHEAGITVGALARIKRGEANPTWTTVRGMASALGVSLAELGRAVDEHAD